MKKYIALVAAALLSFGLTACPPVGEQTVEGTITLPEADSPFIAFNIWVKAGSQNDPEGKEGLAALTAALLSSGATTENTYENILEALYPMAAGYGSSVDKEMSVFTGRIHIDNLDAYYELFRDHLLKPAFSEEDFNRIKNQTITGLEQTRRYARDEELSKELLMSMVFKGTPYEHPEEGYVQSVKGITLDDVKQFYADYYVSNNIVVGLGGGYPDGFVKKVRDDFNTLPEKEVAEVPASVPQMPEGVHVLLVDKDNQSVPISIGFPIGMLRDDESFVPMMAANTWFGLHRNSFSNLYQVIRETRGMNYGDYSYIEAFPAGYATQQPRVNVSRKNQIFEIWIRPISETAPGNLHDRALFATRAALRELDAFINGGMTEETLAKTKQFLRNFVINWGDTISRRLAYAIDDAFYGIGGSGYLAGLRDAIDALDLETVNTTIKSTLEHNGMWIVMVTRDAEKMKQMLLDGTPTPITYAGTQPDAVLQEDQEIASFPIPVSEENITIIPIQQVYESR